MKRLILYFLFSLSLISQEKVIISDIIFRGNKEIPNNILKKDLKSLPRTHFSTEKLAHDYGVLRDNKYIKNVEISPEIKNGKFIIVFNITEKDNVYNLLREDKIYTLSDILNKKVPGIVKEVSIEGAFQVNDEIIAKELPLKKGNFFSIDEMNLGKNNLESTGFFKRVNVSYVKDGNDVYITYNLEENPIIGSKIIIEGSTVFSEKDLLSLLLTKKDQILNRKVLEKDVENLRQTYLQKDYFGVEIYPNFDSNNNLVLKIYEAKVGKISFKRQLLRAHLYSEPKLHTKDYVLMREVVLKEGTLLKSSDLRATIYKLRRLGYFSNIHPEITIDENDPTKRNITFRLMEEKGGITFNGSLSGTIESLMASLSFSNNNLLGRGQKINLSYQYEFSNGWKGNISFFDPWIYGTNGLSFGIDLYRFHASNSLINTFGTSSNRYLGNDIYTGSSIKLGYRLADNITLSLKNDFKSINYLDFSSETLDTFLENTLSPILEYDIRDNYLDPSSGLLLSLSFDWSKRIKNPYVNYVNFEYKPDVISTELKALFYFNFLFERNIIASRINLGYAEFIGASGPFYENKFLLGGALTLRGYEPYSIRGMKYFLINIEDRITLYKGAPKIEMAIFFDIGHATKESLSEFFNFNDLKKSLGLSFRLKNFIIPLSVDFSFPLNEKENYIRPEISLQYIF